MKSKKLKSLKDARFDLLKRVKKWIKYEREQFPRKLKILRHEIALENAHPLEWLILQNCPNKIFWENRNQKEQFAGIGAAIDFKDENKGYEKILIDIINLLKNSSKSIRIFGGTRFDSKVKSSEEWNDWGVAQFTLPMVELSIVNDKITLACQIYTGNDIYKNLKNLEKILETMRVEDISIPDNPLIRLERIDLPEYRQWCEIVEKGLKNIYSGKLKKLFWHVVLFLVLRVSMILMRYYFN